MAGKKNGNGEGSIRKRPDDTWEGRYMDAAGSRHSVYGKTRAEVAKKLNAVLQQIADGGYVQPDRITVGQWLDRWFEVYAKPRLRDKTAAVHEDNIRLHIKPVLGCIGLQKLKTDQIQAFVNDLSAQLSIGTVLKVCEPLKMALKQAYRNKMILSNPADFIQMPKGERKEKSVLSIENQNALLGQLPGNTAGAALHFILCTGLRASELCGLRWSDIGEDFFTIRRSAQYVPDMSSEKHTQKLSINPPKTSAGRREIPLIPQAKAVLEEQRLRQMKERLKAGEAWRADDAGRGECYVFTSELGGVMDRSNLARVLRSALKRADLPNMGLHALRHTFATNAVNTGANLRALSDMLGHTKVAFTMQQYVHPDMEAKRAVLEAVAAATKTAK